MYGLHQTVTPSKADVGDTVTIKCSLTSPRSLMFSVLRIIRRGNVSRKEIASNGFLNPEFSQTGRYENTIQFKNLNDNKGSKQLLLTVTIKGIRYGSCNAVLNMLMHMF